LGMTFYKQFIIYKIVPSESRPGKTDKFPCDYRTGRVKVDCQDPQFWTDAAAACDIAEALGLDHGVGFVFTENDPFWFLDTDGSYRDNQWSDLAKNFYHSLNPCAFEVSSSNTGSHHFGIGNVPEHKKTNKAYGIELYTSGRFVALTGTNATGDCRTDATETIANIVNVYFKPDVKVDNGHDGSGPRDDWNGPTDDAELIELALNFPQSAKSRFGNKASFRDIWEVNIPALAKSYPDGASYDESAVDMACAMWLAFFTGCDGDRIERVMRSNAKLYRDKWDDHATYLRELTIEKACGACENVYKTKKLLAAAAVEAAKRRHEQIAENVKIGKGSDDHPTSSVLTAAEMLGRYVYIIEGKRVVDLECPRRIFALDEWKSAHKSSFTVLESGTNKGKQVETTRLPSGGGVGCFLYGSMTSVAMKS
jgi:primase-polymerase (primpol)-like protein